MLEGSPARALVRRPAARILGSGLIFAAVLAGGCGSGDPSGRQAISGSVILDGQPLGDGAILLEPPAPYEGGTAVGATIRRGSFVIPRDRGPTPGTYRVRIYSSSGAQATPAAGQTDRSRRPMVERLPEVYNTKSEWRVDVTAGGSNRFRFDLHAAAGG
jgi:hypothetical protein